MVPKTSEVFYNFLCYNPPIVSSTTVTPRITLPPKLARLNFIAPLGRILPHLLVILLVAVGMFFAHELGHAIVAQFFGARVVMFNVLGMQWFPQLEWMPQLGFGGYVYWFAPVSLTNHRLIVMAGSTFTLLLSVGAVMALNVLPIRGIARTALAVMALYFLDSLVKILPVLGWIPLGWNSRFTRSFSEAYFAAVGLGIPSQIYLAAIVLLSILNTIFLIRALRR